MHFILGLFLNTMKFRSKGDESVTMLSNDEVINTDERADNGHYIRLENWKKKKMFDLWELLNFHGNNAEFNT